MNSDDCQIKIRGFSFIESLIAILLLTIMMLTFGEIMLSALNRTAQGFYQTIASEQLNGLAEMMVQFPDQYSQFLSQWNQDNQKLLPEGRGEIKEDVDAYRITLKWHAGNLRLEVYR